MRCVWVLSVVVEWYKIVLLCLFFVFFYFIFSIFIYIVDFVLVGWGGGDEGGGLRPLGPQGRELVLERRLFGRVP